MKLTQEKRKQLAAIVASAKFDENINIAENERFKLARKIYDSLFGGVNALVCQTKIPIEYINHRGHFDIEIPNEWRDEVAHRHNLHKSTQKTYRHTVFLKSSLPLSCNHPNHAGCRKEDYIAHAESVQECKKMVQNLKQYKGDLVCKLAGATTLKNLKERFPDIVKFIPSDWEKVQTKNLPAPVNVINDLDNKYGVK